MSYLPYKGFRTHWPLCLTAQKKPLFLSAEDRDFFAYFRRKHEKGDPWKPL